MTKAGTPAKLRDGSWGARVEGEVAVGDEIQIRSKGGKEWTARVTLTIWTGPGVTICATDSGDRRRQAYGRATVVRPVQRATPRRPVEGEIEVSRPSGGRDDCYEPGDLIHTRRPLAIRGGSQDGCYYVVVAHTGRWRDDDEDQWMIGGIVRPATEDECRESAARRSEVESRASLSRALHALPSERVPSIPDSEQIPTSLIPRERGRESLTGERVALIGDAIYHERHGDPDQLDACYAYVVRIVDPPAEILATVRRLLNTGAAGEVRS